MDLPPALGSLQVLKHLQERHSLEVQPYNQHLVLELHHPAVQQAAALVLLDFQPALQQLQLLVLEQLLKPQSLPSAPLQILGRLLERQLVLE